MTVKPPAPRPFRWMRLFHVTLATNLNAIRAAGLLPRFARGAPRVWLADFDRLPWAVAHVSGSHGWDRTNLVIVYVTVPSEWLVQARPGIYFTPSPVPAEHLGATVTPGSQY